MLLGFTINELQQLEDLKNEYLIVKEKASAVIKIRMYDKPDEKEVNTGFFINKDPPNLLTVHHVLPSHAVVKTSEI